MELSDIYRPPTANLGPAPPLVDDGERVPSAIVADLVAARGWIRFFAVLGFLASMALLVSGVFVPSLSSSFALTMLIIASAYILVLVKILVHTARGISRLERIPTTKNFEDTLAPMSIFWRIAGIVFGVATAIYLIGVFFVQLFIGGL